MTEQQHVVIVGAGFGGISAAQQLLGKTKITIIDKNGYFLFTPRIVDVLLGIPERKLKVPLHSTRLLEFVQGTATQADRTEKRVIVQTEEGMQSIEYDYLILSNGSSTNYYGIPGAEQYCLSYKTYEDAVRLKEHVANCLTEAASEQDAKKRSVLLSFIVIGGGPTGIEVLFALHEHIASLRLHDSIRDEVKLILIQNSTILPGFPDTIRQHVLKKATKHGFYMLENEKVTAVDKNKVTTTKSAMFAAIVLWTAGVQPSKIDAKPPLPFDKGVQVDTYLQAGPDVFAVGDCSAGRTAQTARSMGVHAGRNILRLLKKRTPLPFTYRTKGSIILLGNTAVMHTGFTATGILPSMVRNAVYAQRLAEIRKVFK